MNEIPKIIVSNELEYYDQLHQQKYRDQGQSFLDHCRVTAQNLASNELHGEKIFEALLDRRFLPAGRVQAALGATEREVSPFNCSVSQSIEDSMDSIMASLSNAAKILRLGTGIGYNFSRLRPKGAEIKKLKTESSGPLSFMKMFDVMASTIASSGHRRGAQMGIMNVDHPDIEAFIDAKMERNAYRQFNFSVGVSDKFMEAISNSADWDLVHNGHVYKTIDAGILWEKITKNAYYSAEPGVIFIDRLNSHNNLHYCEHIEATNPCSEQPLPPYGLCLLGSFNLVAYLQRIDANQISFNYPAYVEDIKTFVEAYDNIFDKSIYAIPEHKSEAINKRRMGLGLTGIANAIELIVGRPCYGEPEFCKILNNIASCLTTWAYDTSADLAKQRGPFNLYQEAYNDSKFIHTLPVEVRDKIRKTGIRNSHLISYAPCGTISQCAGNVSSGVEPVFYGSMSRKVHMREGQINVTLNDYNVRHHGFLGKTLEACTVEDHLNVAEIIQKYTDSAVSKTVNVASNCSYENYERIYLEAYKLGLKGLTVYRPTELRGSIISEAKPQVADEKQSRSFADASCVNGACSM